jgi:hypothetical protein
MISAKPSDSLAMVAAQASFIALEGTSSKATQTSSRFTLEQLGLLYARIALGAAFLSAVAGRFGFWDGKSAGITSSNSPNTQPH